MIRRNCALDVCCEEKTFRVICSHLNPLSVMHLYVKDLDDLLSLVTSRGSEMHVHICVDGQTGLVTILPGFQSGNIDSATTVSHRVEKMLEDFIMEHLLTATNTFHCEDDMYSLQLQREPQTSTDKLHHFI